MVIYNMLGQYTFATIAGVVCLVLIIIQGREQLKSKTTYMAAVIFVCTIVGISIVMYCSYSSETILNIPSTLTVFRGIDYFLYAFLLFAWVNLMHSFIKEASGEQSSCCYTIGKSVSILGIFLFVIISVFFMDASYYIKSPFVRTFYRSLEISFSLSSIIIGMICVFKTLPCLLISANRKYVIMTSSIISFYFLMQIWLTDGLGFDKFASWGNGPHDISGWVFCAINILTCYFIYKNDFQKLYTKSSSKADVTGTVEHAMDQVAEMHRLTHREREIISLLFFHKITFFL